MGYLETSIQHSLHGSKEVEFCKNIMRLFNIVNGKGNPYANIHDT